MNRTKNTWQPPVDTQKRYYGSNVALQGPRFDSDYFYWWISAQQIFDITNREVNYLSASRSDANWNRFQCQKGCEHWQHCKKRQQFSEIPIAYQNLCFNILYRWVWWLKFYCRLSLWIIARDAFKPLAKKMNKCENQINCNLVTPTTKGKRRNLRIQNGCHLV